MDQQVNKQIQKLIVEKEVTSQSVYQKKYETPIVPSAKSTTSGVTIGIGYDLGHKSVREFKSQWGKVLKAKDYQLLAKSIGLKGLEAQKFLDNNSKQLKNIRIQWDKAVGVLRQHTIPNTIKDVQKIYPCKQNNPNCFVALTSLVFNRGTSLTDKKGNRRKEMREISEKIKEGATGKQLAQFVSTKLVEMKRIWADRPDCKGLLKRREDQAAMALRDRNLPPSSKPPSSPMSTQPGTPTSLKSRVAEAKRDMYGGVDFYFKGLKLVGNTLMLQKCSKQAGISIRQLVVPLKILFDPEIKVKNISVSLDPLIPTEPDGPFYKKIYYPLALEGTEIGQAMIEADYLMKQLNLGCDQDKNPFPYPQQLVKIGLTASAIYSKPQQAPSTTIRRSRFWIVIKRVIYDETQGIYIKDVKMGLQSRVQQIGPEGTLIDSPTNDSPQNDLYTRLFTEHYQLLAKLYPVFARIKEYAKAVVIARTIYQNEIAVDRNLIDVLFQKSRKKTSQTVNKLQNKLTCEVGVKQFITTLSGGCDLNPPSCQINLAKRVATGVKSVPTQDMEPFPFQKLQTCSTCDQLCQPDQFSQANRECIRHSRMVCPYCQNLIYPNQLYRIVKSADKVFNFHSKCFCCDLCCELIGDEDNFQVEEGRILHLDCYDLGQCSICKQIIWYPQREKAGSVNGGLVHIQCYLPKCQVCKTKIEGEHLIINDKKVHKQCDKCALCSQPIVGSLLMLQGNRVHLTCVKCAICERTFKEGDQIGVRHSDQAYVHFKC